MNRDEALNLILQKDWSRLLAVLKDNVVFDDLISDEIFRELFRKYFVDELFKDLENTKEDRILELVAIFNFHKSNSYKFSLQQSEHEKLVIKLVDLTGDYFYAKEYPNNHSCKIVIQKYEKEEEEKIRFIRENYELRKNLNVVEVSPLSQDLYSHLIFNSPQEIEFYYAIKVVFPDAIILPNAALSTVLDNRIMDKLEKQEKWFFLTTTVDFVIVDSNTYKPIYFFELESSFHDNPEQIIKDNIKNRLISEAGCRLFRTRKLSSGDKTEFFVRWLREVKNQ